MAHLQVQVDSLERDVAALAALARRNYEDASRDFTLMALGNIARVLGEPLDTQYGPKYQLKVETPGGTVSVFVDDNGGYQTASIGGREVMNTHPANHRFIPGPWVGAVLALASQAEEGALQQRLEEAKAAAEEAMARAGVVGKCVRCGGWVGLFDSFSGSGETLAHNLCFDVTGSSQNGKEG